MGATESRWVWIAVVAAITVLPGIPAAGAVVGSATHAVSPAIVLGRMSAATPGCSAFGLCPAMVRGAYNMTGVVNRSTTNGTGQTVVVIDACGDPTVRTDLSTFDSQFHLPAAKLAITHLGSPPNRCAGSWSIETALDVEWAHVMAPGAKIHLLLTRSGSNSVMFSAWSYALTNHLGSVYSNSWGAPGGCNATVKGYLRTAARSNVTVVAAAGDSGAWGTGTSAPSFMPGDCRQVVSVGGTTLTASRTSGYGGEAAWSFGGGGYASRYPEPAYESGVNISAHYAVMSKPDVAAVADPSTGVWVYDAQQGGWGTVGGTSVATPLWAGFFADVNSQRASVHLGGLGDVTPFLYLSVYGNLGKNANYSATMHDVTRGSNGWSAGTGWDAATGLGSMNGYPLVQLLGNAPSA